jgi:hypothetical protein
LNIDAAIEDILMHAGRLQKMLPRQWSLRGVEECDQERVFSLRQCDSRAVWRRQPAGAAVKDPTAESAKSTFSSALPCQFSPSLAAQDGLNPRQEFAKPERFGNVVVGPKLQADHPVNLVGTMICGDDNGHIGSFSHLAQHIEPILLAKPQVKDHHSRLLRGELLQRFLCPGHGRHVHIVIHQIVSDHVPQGSIIVDKEDPYRAAEVEVTKRVIVAVGPSILTAECRFIAVSWLVNSAEFHSSSVASLYRTCFCRRLPGMPILATPKYAYAMHNPPLVALPWKTA